MHVDGLRLIITFPKIKEDEDRDLIFFDFCNWFMISYSETTAIIINVVVSVVTLIGVIISLISFGKHCGKCLDFYPLN